MRQALAFADIAERAAQASSGSGGGDWQLVLTDLRHLHSTTVSLMDEWFKQDNDNNLWFYSALRLAGFVLCDMIDRFEEARADPSREREALDGLAALPEIADIVESSAVRPDVDDHDGNEITDKEMALWDRAFATGLVKSFQKNLEKRGPQLEPDANGNYPPNYRVIQLAYDDDTNELHRVPDTDTAVA